MNFESDKLSTLSHFSGMSCFPTSQSTSVSDNFNQELLNIPLRKKTARIRKNQKEPFDYRSHITRELQKLDLANMNDQEKKQAIIRIRNRMSA